MGPTPECVPEKEEGFFWTRLLLTLGGAMVMMLSPGSRAHVETICVDTDLYGFCGLNPGQRVVLCVCFVSVVFLFDILVSGIWIMLRGLFFTTKTLNQCLTRETLTEVAHLFSDVCLWGRRYVTTLGKRIKRPAIKSAKKSMSFVKKTTEAWRAAYARYRKQRPKKVVKKKKFDLRKTLSQPPDVSEPPEEVKEEVIEEVKSEVSVPETWTSWLWKKLGDLEDDKLHKLKKKRKDFPLVLLLGGAISVVGVTTGIEARQLWTEHAAATGSVERYLSTSLVLRVGAAMHETQRERGLASTYLGDRQRSADTLMELERQYGRADAALCDVLEALLRHADVGADTEIPPSQEMATLAAPIFGIIANRRRDSFYVGRELCPGGDCAACAVSHSGVGDYTCRTAQCRELAAVLFYLQSARNKSGGSSTFAIPAEDDDEPTGRARSFEFYTGLNRNLLRLATSACVELVRNLRAGPSLAASLLYAYVNLAAFKEKAGIERGVISTELNFALTADPQSSLVRHRRALAAIFNADVKPDESRSPRYPPLSSLVRLREVVAQQDVYLSSYLSFATERYVAAYEGISKEACVVDANRMRAALLARLAALETSISGSGFFDYAPDLLDDAAKFVVFDQPPQQQQQQLQPDEARLKSVLLDLALNDELWFTPKQWWNNQTCRIDHLHRVSEALTRAIHAEADASRTALSIRALRLAAPLLACFVFTLLLGARAIRAYIKYRDSTERRVLKLESKKTLYRDLLSRWAPLSSWMLDDDSLDDSSSSADASPGDEASLASQDLNGLNPDSPQNKPLSHLM